MSRPSSHGKCVFCQNDYSGRGISRHLETCKARQAATDVEGVPRTKHFHLAVRGTHSPEHWLNLQVSASATLQDLDSFLRGIWLECCGHLSEFEIMGQSYMSTTEFGWNDERDMNFKLGQLLTPGLKFAHQYDFGTTTHLELRVIAEREINASAGQPIQIMARNDPLDYLCEVCDKAATMICVYCGYTLVCDECAETHECGEDGFLPVVNSPRMGMCGYSGDAW
jgi:hypothetical protein